VRENGKEREHKARKERARVEAREPKMETQKHRRQRNPHFRKRRGKEKGKKVCVLSWFSN
jgi:hypothetical protein